MTEPRDNKLDLSLTHLLLLWHREETDRMRQRGDGEETERVERAESVDRTGARQQVVASQSVWAVSRQPGTEANEAGREERMESPRGSTVRTGAGAGATVRQEYCVSSWSSVQSFSTVWCPYTPLSTEHHMTLSHHHRPACLTVYIVQIVRILHQREININKPPSISSGMRANYLVTTSRILN